MRRCSQCNESSEDQFDTCWNCGAELSGMEDFSQSLNKGNYEKRNKLRQGKVRRGTTRPTYDEPASAFNPEKGLLAQIVRGGVEELSTKPPTGALSVAFLAVLFSGILGGLLLGLCHIVTGTKTVSGINGIQLIERESFGYSEIYIDADALVQMPRIAAIMGHPTGYRVVARLVSSRNTVNDAKYVVADDNVLDKRRNLIWKKCLLGMRWDGNDCAGSAKSFTEPDAIEIALAASKVDGVAWRVPNKVELNFLVSDRHNKEVAESVLGKYGWESRHLYVNMSERSFGQSFNYIDFKTGEDHTVFGDNGAPLRLVRTND